LKQILAERYEFIKRIHDISPSESIMKDLASQGLGQNKIKFYLYTNGNTPENTQKQPSSPSTAGNF